MTFQHESFHLIPFEEDRNQIFDIGLFEKLNDDSCQDKFQREALENYWELTTCPEKFQDFNLVDIYYNRLYWFHKFYHRYKSLNGSGKVDIEQYEFKLLEQGENLNNINWKIVEQIMNVE